VTVNGPRRASDLIGWPSAVIWPTYAADVPETPDTGGAYDLPEWVMPPQMIGAQVSGPQLIARSERAVVVTRQVLAFPTGVQVEVEAHARGARAAPPSAAVFDDRPRETDLRFRLRFSDGREAAQDDEAGLRTGRGPILMLSRSENSYGGPEECEDAHLILWAWPLPPSGPVDLTCSWPSYGLRDTSLVLDGDAILAAAVHAQPFWPVRPS
jgi:hypothetical protein